MKTLIIEETIYNWMVGKMLLLNRLSCPNPPGAFKNHNMTNHLMFLCLFVCLFFCFFLFFLFVEGFISRSKIVHWYGDVTITGEGLHSLIYTLIAIEQWGFFCVPHLVGHEASVHNSNPRGPVIIHAFWQQFGNDNGTFCFHD